MDTGELKPMLKFTFCLGYVLKKVRNKSMKSPKSELLELSPWLL